MTSVTLARSDPSVRRKDYLNAFRFWLAHPDQRLRRILLIENSGADLSEFQEEARGSSKEVEIISTTPAWPPEGLHYGYSELLMMDEALSKSRLYQESSHLIKATGTSSVSTPTPVAGPSAFRVRSCGGRSLQSSFSIKRKRVHSYPTADCVISVI